MAKQVTAAEYQLACALLTAIVSKRVRNALDANRSGTQRRAAPTPPAARTARRVDLSATGAQRRAAAARVRGYSASMPGGLSTDPAYLLGATMAAMEHSAVSRQAAARVHADRISKGRRS
jgi:hypothetical protein